MKNVENETILSFTGDHLGDFVFSEGHFPLKVSQQVSACIAEDMSTYAKHELLHKILFQAIQEAPTGQYLLSAIVDFIAQVRNEGMNTYHFLSFEFWLLHNTQLSEEEQAMVRGKIVGCHIPRAAYQCHLPIGNNLDYEGPHFVAAHRSPDMDTTVCSFQTFLDAFVAKVGTTRHYWFLPHGPPEDSHEIQRIFVEPFGKGVFSAVAYTDTLVRVSALDLISQKNISFKTLSEPSFGNDEERAETAVILVDDEGCYLGDWRSIDFDAVRSIVNHFDALLVNYQNFFLEEIITFFSVANVSKFDVERMIEEVLGKSFHDLPLSNNWSDKQQELLSQFMQKVLGIKQGIEATFDELANALQSKGFFQEFAHAMRQLAKAQIFHTTQAVLDDRAIILTELKEVIAVGVREFEAFREYLDTLDVAFNIKEEVLGFGATTLSHLSEYEDIQEMMRNYQHLTVTYQEGNKQYVLGVIHARSLQRSAIGTMAFRDFSNFEETDKPSYMQVISVLDHHKSNIVTSMPYSNITMDAQSANTILGHLKMGVYDEYSTGGMDLESINHQLTELQQESDSPAKMRKMQKLLKKKEIAQSDALYWVSVDREGIDYLQFLFAILDDTDMLTKVTEFDVQVVCGLINRLKTLQYKKEMEIVDFDDVPRDQNYATTAAAKLLQNNDVYSIYTSNFTARKEMNEVLIKQAAKDPEAPFFQDTKTMNKYAYITQFKRYSDNQATLEKYMSQIRKSWVARCQATYEENPQIKFFMLMLSTIASAEELYSQKKLPEGYRDQLWYWIPEQDKKASHYLKNFLSSFIRSPRMSKQRVEAECLGRGNPLLKEAFKTGAGPQCEIHQGKITGPHIIVQYIDPMSMNSRKAAIAPFL